MRHPERRFIWRELPTIKRHLRYALHTSRIVHAFGLTNQKTKNSLPDVLGKHSIIGLWALKTIEQSTAKSNHGHQCRRNKGVASTLLSPVTSTAVATRIVKKSA